MQRWRESLLLIFALAVVFGAYYTFTSPEVGFNLAGKVQEIIEPPITLLFVGDMMLTRSVGISIHQNGDGDPRYPFLHIAENLRSADLTIGNLEGPASSRGTNVGSIYSFRHPPERIAGLTYAGFDVLSLANNHIFDYGAVALGDTVDLLEEAGIASIGAGRNFAQANKPHIADVRGTKIGFLSYTNLYPATLWAGPSSPGVSNPTLENIKSVISALKLSADLVVILFHWGDEYQPHSHPREQELARAMVDAGADLIVGHHPHVVQEVEEYKGKYIAYSLGNFIFDQNFSPETMKGLALRATIRENEIESIEKLPTQLSPTFQVSFVQ